MQSRVTTSVRRRAPAALVLLALSAAGTAVGAAPATAPAPATGATNTARPVLPTPPPLDTAPYTFRTVEGAGGVPLNVVSVGNPQNPPILLIHGLAQSYLSFEPQFRSALAERFHLVSFDLRGHGNSGKPWERAAYQDPAAWGEDVRRVVDALQLKKPVVLGWSYGTLVAMDYLRLAGPDAVAGLVLVGAYGGLTPPADLAANPMPPEMARNRQRQFTPDLSHNWEAARFTAGVLTAKPMPQEWRDRAAAIAMTMPRIAREGMFMRRIDARDLLPGMQRLPVLINVGTKDTSTPEPAARDLAKQLPRSRVSVYEGVGHSPFVEEPARFNRELGEFAAAAVR